MRYKEDFQKPFLGRHQQARRVPVVWIVVWGVILGWIIFLGGMVFRWIQGLL